MNVAVGVALAALAAGAGCKKRSDDAREAMVTMQRFTDRSCACKNKECAEAVQNDMMRWGEQMAKHAAKTSKPDPQLVREMEAVTVQYGKCMTRLLESGPALDDDAPGNTALHIEPWVKRARAQAEKHPKKVAMSKLEVSYARSDGTLDPQYGKLEIDFRVPPAPPPDDPKRPIGAPLPPAPSGQHDMDCPTYVLERGKWAEGRTLCMGLFTLGPPRCTVAQVWARAIERDQAPAAALASLELHEQDGAQTWQFTIVDGPRNVDIRKQYADDCEPVLEKPAK